MALKTVIDTNIIVSALSSRSEYHWIIQSLLNEAFELYITDEILLEYEEILGKKYSPNVASNFLRVLKELPNVHFSHIFFKWDLIHDKDDNKFVDCYVSANADHLITHDRHFSVLNTITFPKVSVINIPAFKNVLSSL